MDLITSAVAAALANGVSDTGHDSVAEPYRCLTAALARLDGAADVLAAIASLEANADSSELRLALSKALARARAPDDMTTLFAAQALLDQLSGPQAAPTAARPDVDTDILRQEIAPV